MRDRIHRTFYQKRLCGLAMLTLTASYDARTIPQIYQGATVRYGDDERDLTALRVFRYKSRIDDSFDRTRNYNDSFKPFPPDTTRETDGFWGVGGAEAADAGPAHLKGQAWVFNYQKYADMYYAGGTVARRWLDSPVRLGPVHPRNRRGDRQSESRVHGIDNLQGALDGPGLQDFFAYPTQKTPCMDVWENRLKTQYSV